MSLPRTKRVLRGGRAYWYHRAPGGALTPLPDPDDPDFVARWAEIDRAARPAAGAPERPGPRSLAALFAAVERSAAFRALAATTQANRRAIHRRIERTKEGKGALVSVSALTPALLEADVAKLSPAAGRNRLKVWRAALAEAARLKWIAASPAAAIRPPRVRETPHRAMTADEAAKFRDRWPLGTAQRLAFELLWGTGARRSDVVALGRQHLEGGRLRWRQRKTGLWVEAPVGPELAAAIERAPKGRMTFLETAQGAARTAKGFGDWWAKACVAAGVEARAHGIRHALGAAAAEGGASEFAIAAGLGHAGPREAARYTAAARRRVLTEAAHESASRVRAMETPPDPDGNAVELKR